MTIRRATLEDVRALARLHHAAFETPGWTESFWENSIKSIQDLTLVATDDQGDLTGLCCLRRVEDEAEILTFCVRPLFRRQGVGKALLSAAQKQLRTHGCSTLFLEVSEHNLAARRLYAGVGFVENGRRRDYYGHGDSAVLMRWTT